MSQKILGIHTGDVGNSVVGSLVGITNKTGTIIARVHLLASRQISGPTLLWAYRLEELRIETSLSIPLQNRVPVRIDLPNHVGQLYLASGRLPTTILGGQDLLLSQSVDS